MRAAGLWDLLRALSRIARNPAVPGIRKTHVLSRLLRLTLQPASGRPGTIRLFGSPVEFFDAASLLHLFRELFVELSYYVDGLPTAPLIVDCGSNLGISILFFKRLYPDCRVVGFEPDPATFEMLKRNVAASRLMNVELHDLALGRERGRTKLFIDRDRPGWLQMSTRGERGQPDSIEVKRDTLSRFVTERVDLLKLDVEGAELEILEDLMEHGKLGSIDRMLIEFHHHIRDEEDLLAGALNILESSGFGYQLQSYLKRPIPSRTYQNVLIYAYRI